MITIDSAKISQALSVLVYKVCFAQKFFAYYAEIMLNAFAIHYYAQNYADIIGSSLVTITEPINNNNNTV